MKVGVFSGTFDPVHSGHVAFCLEAKRVCGLDRVVLLPEQNPRGKENVTSLEHRIAMLELATKDYPDLEVLTLNSSRFTVEETLPELRRLFPDDELTLLLGSDVVNALAGGWPGIKDLCKKMKLVIGLRHGATKEAVDQTMEHLQHELGIAIDYRCIESPEAQAASTKLRGVEHSDPRVAAYIAKHKLYGAY